MFYHHLNKKTIPATTSMDLETKDKNKLELTTDIRFAPEIMVGSEVQSCKTVVILDN